MQVMGRNEPGAGPGMAENGDAPWPGRGRNPAREPTSYQPAGFMPWLGGAGSGRPPGPSAPAPVRTRNSCPPHQHDLPQGAAWRRAGNDDTSPGRQRRRERLGSCVAVLARRTAAGLVLALAAALVLATPALAQDNLAPVFSSSERLSVVENETEVGTVEATDPDSEDSVTYALTGGADLARFELNALNATTTVLSFREAPDHESPADVASTNPVNAAGNNEYIVIVTATGGTAGRARTTEQTLTVTVTGVNEPPVATSATVSRERSILLPHGSPVTWTFPEALFTDPEDNAEQVLGFALPPGVGGSLHSGYSSGVEALLDVAPVPPSGSIAGGFTMSPAAGLTPEQFVAVYGAVSSYTTSAVVIASDGDHTVTGHVGPTLYVAFDASAYFAGASYEEDQRWTLDNASAVYEGASGNVVRQGAGWTATIAGSRSWHTGTPPSSRLTPVIACRDAGAGGSVVNQSTDWPAAGAADSSHFSVGPGTTTGAAGLAALSFAQALDYEAPADADGDNVYRVRLYNSHDLHGIGGEGTGLGCTGSGIDLQILVKDAGPPSAPSMVEAAFDLMTTPFDLVVTWEAPAGFVDPATNAVVTEDGPPVIDYDYRYRVQDTAMWTEVTNTEITAATASIAGLGTDKNYEVQVRAESTEGEGDWSASATSASVTVPSVSTVALSSDPGSDATYAIGDAVEARVTFTEAVDVTGTPTLTIDVGGSDETLGYHSGTGTAALLFTGYTVAESEEDPDGIAIGGDKLATGGGTITKAGVSGIDAVLTHPAVAADSGHKVDGVRPTLVTTGGDAPRTSADGTGVVLTYSEALSATTTPVTAFTVTVVGSSRVVSAVETADTEVTLTLASAVASGEAVTVAYDDPTANDDTNAIQDEAGNDAAGFAAQTVTNDALSVPSVSTVGLISDPGSDATYAIGDAVEARVTFTEAVDVTGTPTLTIDVGGSDETLGYHSGTGTAALLFTGYTVAESEEDPDGIAIEANKLATGGGTITKAGVSGIDAVLTHPAVAADSGHKVDGVRPTLVTTGGDAPRTSADGTKVVLTYSEALSATTTPVTAFTVMVVGSSRDVSAVEAADTEVTLTLASAVASGEAVTVDYEDPTANDDTNAIQDEAGNDAAGFATARSVANNVPSVPSVSTVALSSDPGSDATYAIGDAVEARVTFTEAVDVTGTPTLTIDVGGSDETLGYHSGTGTATLRFTGYTVAESEEDPDGIAIGEDKLATGGGTITKAGVSSIDAVLTHPAVAADSGHKVDGVRPTLVTTGGDAPRTSADGTKVVLTYSEALSATTTPVTAFTVTVVGSSRDVSAVEAAGTEVTLTLASAVASGEAVTVDYDDPTANDDTNAIQDEAGNDAAGFATARSVANDVPSVPRVSTVALSSNPGSDATYAIGDAVEARVTFTEAVDVTGTPTLTIDVGGSDETLGYHAGTGTATLLFTGYTVAERDEDPDGIAIEANRLNLDGGTTTKAGVSGIDAVLTHPAVAADSGHKVDGVRPALVTTGEDAPRTSADGTKVVLAYNEALSATTTPASAFMVTVAGSSRGVSAVEASGTAVTLTLASEVASGEAVTVAYDDPTANDDTNAIQDASGNDADTVSAQSVTNGSTAARPRLGVSNGHAREGEGETIDFVVQLQPATGAQVTVDYRTEDVTATAGEDYEAASGTLTFSPGETEKTLRVPIVDDDHDDDGETFTLRLSNATGAWIGDGEGTGTIRSTGAMPRAWLARFGRTVSEHVLDAVAGRLSGPRGSGTELRIGGQSIAASGDAEDRENAMVEAETQARVAALADWLEGGDGDPDDPEAGRLTRTRTLAGRELFTGTSFAVTGETAHGGHMAAWGRGAVTRFDGRDGDLAQDGEVLTGMIGADLANGRWKTGLVASRSRGKGDYRSPRGAGEVSSTLTALHPWVGLAVSERLSVWAAAGYGEGRLELTPEGQDPMETDIEYRKGAAGAVNEVLAPGRKDGARLALRTDARFTRTTSEAVTAAARPESSVDGGILSAAQADVWLLRLGVEGSRRFALGERRTGLTPSFEFGLRRDGGDAETGFGVDIGAGLTVSDPRRGLSAELAGRGLLAHEASGFREWGASAALGWNPEPSSALGPSASLRHTRGASSTGGTDALLARRTMVGLDANDDERPGGTLEVELGYGFPVLGGRAVGTPHVGLALRESGETLRLGYRYRVGRALDLGIEASRREPANGNPSGHGLIVRASVRW